MTDLDLEAIRKRAAAATPGPWGWDIGDGSMPTLEGPNGNYDHVLSTRVCNECYRRHRDHSGGICTDANATNKAFIAAARTDVPALCDEVERLRVENAKLREIIDEDLSGRPLEFLLHEIADRLHYEGGGSMEDCVRDKEEKILAYRTLADLALRGGEPTRSET